MSIPSGLSRRKFLGTLGTAVGAAGVLASRPSVASAANADNGSRPPPKRSAIKLGIDISLGQGSETEELIRFVRQLGIEWACGALASQRGDFMDPALTQGAVVKGFDGSLGGLGGGPGGGSGPWTEEEVRQTIDQVAQQGLKLADIMLHAFPNVVLGKPERDRDIEHIQQSIRIAGRLGVPVLQYNFEGFRAVEGLYATPGRGGSTYRAFDIRRMKNPLPLPKVGIVEDEEIWARMQYFLKAVIPVAEEAQVRLALHPNDPPIPRYRGVASPFDSIEHWKRVVNFIPSPYNGIVMETGVTAEQGGNVLATIRYFGERDCINHVHFRNVRTLVPKEQYFEVFIDEGQNDMLAAMRALQEIGYSHMLVPDHSPFIRGDTHRFGAWGFALGYIKALMQAATA
jgi:D-mannonate dehydratase